jgi:myotubularin-related protein 1/2
MAGTDVTYLSPEPTKGSIVLTNYRLHFKSGSKVSYMCAIDKAITCVSLHIKLYACSSQKNQIILDVPLGAISRVDKVGGASTKAEHSYGIEIHCKVSSNH